jgi:hypothetical protein
VNFLNSHLFVSSWKNQILSLCCGLHTVKAEISAWGQTGRSHTVVCLLSVGTFFHDSSSQECCFCFIPLTFRSNCDTLSYRPSELDSGVTFQMLNTRIKENEHWPWGSWSFPAVTSTDSYLINYNEVVGDPRSKLGPGDRGNRGLLAAAFYPGEQKYFSNSAMAAPVSTGDHLMCWGYIQRFGFPI